MPLRALVLSFGALSVPMIGGILFPDWTGEEAGVLLWLTALVPAFLLTYYRGWRGASLGLALGMAVLSVTQVVLVMTEVGTPNWSLLFGLVLAYIGICFGVGWVAEMLHNERRKAENMALTDALTELPNRRHATIFLDAAFAAAGRGTPLAVVIFDLDRFKEYNDEHGHQAGDDALRSFGRVLAGISRRMNLVARYGGEEFIAVLASSDTEGATIFADRVCGRLRSTELRGGRVTSSAGIACYEPGMGTPDLLVAAADRALYAAKAAGRDRICAIREGSVVDVTPAERAGAPPAAGAVRTRDATPRRVSPATPAPARPGECILLVDDDEGSLAAVGRMLRRLGYDVIEESHGEDALALFGRERSRIDLVVADLVMPGMSGFTLAEKMTAIEPALRVLYMSGFLHHDVTWSGAPGAATGFIQKPMMLEALATRVRQTLDAPLEGAVSGSGGAASPAPAQTSPV
ncbi:MAG: diguanylate cyclase [Gemmatimonadota bacterium]